MGKLKLRHSLQSYMFNPEQVNILPSDSPEFKQEIIRLVTYEKPLLSMNHEFVGAKTKLKYEPLQHYDALTLEFFSDDDLTYPFGGDCPPIGIDVLSQLLAATPFTINRIQYKTVPY